MPKKVLSSNSNNVRRKQGNILSFVKPQSSSDLLKSKDGLKQGRIDPYLRSKSATKEPDDEIHGTSQAQKKKRQLSDECAVPDLKSLRASKKPKKSPSVEKFTTKTPLHSALTTSPVVDLTNDEKNVVGRKSPRARKSLTGKLKSATAKETESFTVNHESCNFQSLREGSKACHNDVKSKKGSGGSNTVPGDTSKEKDALEYVKENKKCDAERELSLRPNDVAHTENEPSEIKDSFVIKEPENSDHAVCHEQRETTVITDGEQKGVNLSVDDLDLSDSFITAAMDGISPMKSKDNEPVNSAPTLLSCSVPCPSTSHSLVKQRHRITKVIEGVNMRGFGIKVLELENVASKKRSSCTLNDGWVDTKVVEGDIINLIFDDDDDISEDIQISAKKNMIVVHPDILLSGTTVSNAIGCKRRAILNDRFKNTESGDCGKPIMLIGTLVHTIFQNVLLARKKMSTEEIYAMARSEVSRPSLLKDILSLGTTQKQVLKGVEEFIPQILSWVGEYVRPNPTLGVGKLDISLPPNCTHKDLGVEPRFENSRSGTKFSTNSVLSEVQDIEESVWSPLYGLKGKIDVTGEFTVRRQTNKTNLAKLTLPLELKTGKESHSIEHHAQVAIYAMFCEERRKLCTGSRSTIPAGLLLYLKTGNLSCVPLKREDRLGLMMIRNELATYLARTVLETKTSSSASKNVHGHDYKTASFPPTIDDARLCKNCSQLRNCSLVHRSIDRNCQTYRPSSNMVSLIDTNTSHLTQADLDYFEHWVTCIMLEIRKCLKNDLNQYLWLRSPEEREELKLCVTNLKLAGPGKSMDDAVATLQTFKRSHGLTQTKLNIFSENELVTVSGREPAYVAMATGTVHTVNENFITIVTDRNFSGYPSNMTYSIDRHEWPSMNSFNASFHNLSVVMNPSPSSGRLRDLIIHHKEPAFKTKLEEVIPRSSKDDVAKMLRGLNRTQRQAIKRVLLSQDYTLVVGMPGSGKTTTIVSMARILLLCGCRILLTSYTHSAIDNLLMKLIKYKVKFLRLGRKSQIHSSVHRFSEEELAKDLKTPQELDSLYTQANVVGCTCLAVTSHALFTSPPEEPTKRSRFDVCIVDEASQIPQHVCLAPLLHSDRFVLVGDHRQLPPLVRSRKAKSMGADESLFWRLSQHKVALCDLTLQYRMNSAIMDISNHVTYEGRLECALESVATAKLKLPSLDGVMKVIEQASPVLAEIKGQISCQSWLCTAIDPEKPVVFLDTSELQAYEEEMENGICNRTEADILTNVVRFLLQAGCLSKNIGIIAPFRRQLKAIEDCISTLSDVDTGKLEINTVDKYQGRDKNVILLSFVRCMRGELAEKKGELLSDWRRLNVALTRAKHKMVLLGCGRTLMQYDPCKKLLEYLKEKDLIVTL